MSYFFATAEVVQVWVDSVRNCISEKSPGAVEVDLIYKLEAEVI